MAKLEYSFVKDACGILLNEYDRFFLDFGYDFSPSIIKIDGSLGIEFLVGDFGKGISDSDKKSIEKMLPGDYYEFKGLKIPLRVKYVGKFELD
jgi:hypothetical protein